MAVQEILGRDHGAGTPAPVSVIIPAYNEEKGVAAQVDAIRRALAPHGFQYEIIVVDDASADRTAAEALKAGARVLQHPANRGYGASIKTGIKAASFDVIVISDADGTYPAEEIPNLVAQLETADMVVGARIGAQVHVPIERRPAKWLLTWLASRVAGQKIPDLNSGLRAFRRDCVQQYFPILSNRFSFTTTVTLSYLADDYRVVYHPINYYQRIGKSKITPRNFMDFIVLVLRMAVLFQPLKVFVPLALLCGVTGVLKVVYDVGSYAWRTGSFDWSIFYQPVISTSAVLLLLVGLQLLLFGALADGVLRRISLHNGPQVASHSVRMLEFKLDPRLEREVAGSIQERC
jgi:glycosyltransferase involved in cell wall biosynthesis